MPETLVLKVSGTSSPQKVSWSIFKNIQEGKDVEVLSIGAGALNQAVKALIIARGHAAAAGMDLLMRPGFADLLIDGETKTAIKMAVLRQ